MTMSDTPHWPTSALHAADTAFAALTCEPDPLTLDCDSLGADLHLPPGQLPLPTLRDGLADYPTTTTPATRYGENWSSAPDGTARNGSSPRSAWPCPC